MVTKQYRDDQCKAVAAALDTELPPDVRAKISIRVNRGRVIIKRKETNQK